MSNVNGYYRDVLHRQNLIKKFLYDFFIKTASYSRVCLEVFLRKNFGERYFSLATAISALLFLALLPRFFYAIPSFGDYGFNNDKPSFWLEYGTWYAYLVAFCYFSFLRKNEIKRSKSLFNFKKYSRYSGDVNPWFYQSKFFGKAPSIRKIETFCEPALFFIIGIPLIVIGQKLGYLLIINSILYALSYRASYNFGDNYMMDLADDINVKKSIHTFVEGQLFDKNTLVQFRFDPPTEREIREGLAGPMAGESSRMEGVSYAE